MTRENCRCITAFNETPRQGCAIARACAHHNGDRLLIMSSALKSASSPVASDGHHAGVSSVPFAEPPCQ